MDVYSSIYWHILFIIMSREFSDLIYVCKILSPHGVKGDFHIELLSDDVKRLNKLRHAYLINPKKDSERYETIITCINANSLILHSDRINQREEVAKYRFWYIAVSRENAREIPENEYFICDLIGCNVFDRNYGDLGIVHDIIDNGAQMLYQIKKKGEKDLYFPAIEEIIKHTDIFKGSIEVELPKGLFEIYRES